MHFFFSIAEYFHKPWVVWVTLLLSVACRTESPSNNSQGDAETSANSSQSDISPAEEDPKQQTILFFGNSITAGYGLDESQAFPALIQQKIDSLDLSFAVVNAGLSGETTAAGANRIDWVLKQKIDYFVLELGGNDGLRGLNPEETQKNLGIIIEKVKEKYPEVKILLTGIEVPPNMGPDYAQAFREVFPQVAEKYDLALMPFILQDVGGIPELNQADGIHPTPEGHQIIADNLWEVLKGVLGLE